MYKHLKSSGKHMICDIKNIKNVALLDNMSDVKEILMNICKDYNYEVLNIIEHKFEPYGYSLLFLLSESHISVHTFPERNYLSFDIYTCREYLDNVVYDNIYNLLIKHLDASDDSTKVIIDRYF
jgi:S-adenosylmethionine decarboxylase